MASEGCRWRSSVGMSLLPTALDTLGSEHHEARGSTLPFRLLLVHYLIERDFIISSESSTPSPLPSPALSSWFYRIACGKAVEEAPWSRSTYDFLCLPTNWWRSQWLRDTRVIMSHRADLKPAHCSLTSLLLLPNAGLCFVLLTEFIRFAQDHLGVQLTEASVE